MSAYQEYVEEKNRLDAYIDRHFLIAAISENLSGTIVRLEHPGGETATLLLLSADTRKHVVNLLLRQLTSGSSSASASAAN
ncbi:hypothetical protein [Paenibacillus sp. NEAU-GSW1]|uniref:hypothetical protein n=1 Tax=Paenibacillus sp. NEAU-GSW1 TaxID=2682486 RepID=UPI0012E23315|nr:hypothetical protein [Paenibacillus sp. NEAU-GSW1]MUT64419.1 hypothetical protein [Paenibacillus sp. NEAU-GSW1]